MAFSMFPTCDASQGWMTIVLESGTDMEESWLIGTRFPYASTRTLSRRAALARPVRTPVSSRTSKSVAACIRVSRSLITCCMALPLGGRRIAGDDRAHHLAGDDAPDIAPSGEIEHHDGELVIHAERDGGGVHHRQTPIERLDVTHPGKLHRGGILGGIGGIDAVHLGGLEEDLGADLHRAEGSCGVRGEEGV